MKRNYDRTGGIRRWANIGAITGMLVTRAAGSARHSVDGIGPKPRAAIVMSVVASLILFSSLITVLSFADAPRTPRDQLFAMENDVKPLAVGFYVNWDGASYASLKNNIQNLDWVVPSWLYLREEAMDLTQSLDLKALEVIRSEKPKISILAMIQNVSAGAWDGRNLARFLADPAARRARIDGIMKFVADYNLQGVVIDFELIPDTAHKDMLSFLEEVHAAFKAKGWLLAVAAPFDNPDWDYKAYAKACDYLILMGYDEHWPDGDPGPVASQSWLSNCFAARMLDLDPARTIIAIGNYGYDWTVGGGAAESLTVPEAMRRARAANATVELDPSMLNPRYSYSDEGKAHQVWFLNAVSAYYQLSATDRHRPAGYALWRLGGEDPSIWPVLTRAYNAPPPASLPAIAPANEVNFIGAGK